MIYLDNAATTKVDDVAIEKMIKVMKEEFGNPSALYDFGLQSEKNLNYARKQVANALGVKENEIYFTSGGTEGNNTAILGSLTGNKNEEFLTMPIEHSSVHKVYENIKDRKVQSLKVDKLGFLDLEDLKNKINENTRLVSVMHVNNEIGTIQNIEEIGNIIKSKNKNTLFHVDGIPGFCKVPLNVKKAKIDFYTMSAHKIHGPKGVGAIYVKEGVNLKPILIGGGQEKGISPGTENMPGIVAFGEVAEIAVKGLEENYKKAYELKRYLMEELSKISDSLINSTLENSSPYIINASFKDVRGEVLLHFLEGDKIYVSTGSACGKSKKSRVMEAIHLPDGYENGTIRISFSKYTTKEEVTIFIEKLTKYIEEIRSITRRD
ncbi:cysteine desulfurase family protein [Miniphocaeibacter massiliensis]|uniref:cysteine desulfurase family protein n=1 Tax=Miniphocaeibacter massiliensis TaxID=2041841 RepID=UPI000C075BBF|nr:cysteine desulfurase family protein [Miniphocaeibacter massiliensis]